ncbi:TetR/AcrR family transcriptional regulator [Paenibacillus sediminis]|uniref:AcrR family transcriptional regulator n=1 Tax=Paenibacillus sediminis TaxID=664909 RepID=A0ABS4GYV5_9BACL|nr:TetR/AcrR family transcriptional regulator [Paenibacillus sediminis]MBP1935212.1 AcrR family transcriptional regulator [Paenibacillus sediminis]
MTPRTREQNDEIREMRIEQIMKAAAEVYLDKGLLMEMRDVANFAGLGYGTVYHYYKNKYQLLEDLAWSALERARDLAETYLKGDMSKRPDQLQQYCKLLFELWLHNHSVFILYKMGIEQFRQLPNGSSKRLKEYFQTDLIHPFIHAVQKENDEQAGQRALMMIGSLMGCAGIYIHRPDLAFDTNEVMDMLFTMNKKRSS